MPYSGKWNGYQHDLSANNVSDEPEAVGWNLVICKKTGYERSQ
jgi:hypothetical protein